MDKAGRSGSGTGADVEVEDCRAVRKSRAEVVAGEVENGGPILATSFGRGGMEVYVCGVVGKAVKRGRERPLWRCFVGGGGCVCGFVVVVGALVPVPLVAALANADCTTLA